MVANAFIVLNKDSLSSTDSPVCVCGGGLLGAGGGACVSICVFVGGEEAWTEIGFICMHWESVFSCWVLLFFFLFASPFFLFFFSSTDVCSKELLLGPSRPTANIHATINLMEGEGGRGRV